MGPRAGSRYVLCRGVRGEDQTIALTDREPFRFRELADNRRHEVVEGDTLWHLAGRYFLPMSRACGYWWVIADFQPEPIVDPTRALELGRVLVIPSIRALTDTILSEARRAEAS